MAYLTCPDTSCHHKVNVVGDHSNTVYEGAQVFCNRCGGEYVIKVKDTPWNMDGVATELVAVYLEPRE